MSSFVRLLTVELSRLVHRRAALVIVAACVIIPTIIGVSIALDTRPPSDAAIAEAKDQLERDRNDPGYQEQIDQCIENPAEWGLPSNLPADELKASCTENNSPQLDWYLYYNQLDINNESSQGSGIAVTLILSIAMMLIGTTFTGADWASGSVSNQLLFEPRRARVWFAKGVVVTGVAFLMSAVVLTTYWFGLNAVAASRDLDSGGGVLLDCLQMGWRASVVAALAALSGFALTMLFRSTVATLGILFGIALVGGIIVGVLGFEARWNPALNVAAVVADGTTYQAEIPCPPEQGDMMGGYCSEERKISFAQGAGFLGTAVGGTGVLSLLLFRRRDVP